MDSATISTADLAQLLGISKQRISQLVAAGTISKIRHGKFDLIENVNAYCAHLREHAGDVGRPVAGAGSDDLKAEKLKLTAAQREGQELKNAALRGDLVPVAEVRQEWTAIATDLRASLMAIPSRVASRAALSREASVQLEDELRLALEDLMDER